MKRLLFARAISASFAARVPLLPALFLLVASASLPAAETYTVTSTADTNDAGSLRWAINQANANPGSTIQIAASVGTITLQAGLPTITAATTIDGGTGTIITGAPFTGFLTINTPTASLKNLTFAFGTNGTVEINNGSDVSLENVSLQTNVVNFSGGSRLVLSGTNDLAAHLYGDGRITVVNGASTIVGEAYLVGSPVIDEINGTLQLGKAGAPTSLNTESPFLFLPNASLRAYNGEVWSNLYFDYAAGIEKNGPDTVTLRGANLFSRSAADPNITSPVVINQGTLQIAHAQALGQDLGSGVEGPNLTLNGGTLDLGGYSATVSVLTGSAGGVITNGGGTVTFTVDQILSTTYAGILENSSGTLAFHKSGSGTLTLAGANTYSGLTRIDGGTLQISSAANLGDGSATNTITLGSGTLRSTSGTYSLGVNRAITLAAPGTIQSDAGTLTVPGTVANSGNLLTLGGAGNVAVSGVVSGTGGLTKTGAGTATLSGANTYSGTTTISAGTLQIGDGATTGSVAGNIVNNATLAFNRSNALTHANAISGTGSVTKLGAGTLTLTGNNTFSGGFALNGGTVAFGSASALGSGALSFDSGTLAPTADLVLTRNTTLNAGGGTIANAAGYFTLNGNISGTGGLTKTGANILTLAGAHTYTGATTVSAGTLKFAANGATASTLASSSLGIASGAKVIFADSQTFAGTITGAGVIEHEFGGTTILTGAASHTGGTNIIGGTIQIGAGGTTGSLAGNVALSSNGTLAFNRSDALTYSGAISGTGSLSKSGSGTLFLSGTNTYTGATTLNAGRIHLTGTIASSAVTVASGATLSGTGTLGPLTLQSGSTLSPGASPGTLTAGNTTFAGGASYTWEINNATGTAGTHWDLLSISGALNITANSSSKFTVNLTSLLDATHAGNAANFNPAGNYTFDFVTASGGISGFDTDAFTLNTTGFTNTLAGTWSITSSPNALSLTYTASAIPEPSTYAAFVGLVTLAFAAWRRQRRAFSTPNPKPQTQN